MADALGTPGSVVSDEDFRLDIAGLIAAQSTSVAVRTGVMWGPGTTAIISGTSATGTMTVNVGVHHWVTTRAAADGVYLGTKESSTTVNIAAAPGSNSRIDVVYAKQNDAGSTISPDGSTAELYGVVTGTAAVSPTKPALPVGAVEIGTVTVAAGATSTAGAGVTINNTAPLTVARGADIPVRSQAERDALTTFPFLTVKRLDTGAIEARNPGNTAWVSVYDPTTSGLWVTDVNSTTYALPVTNTTFATLTSMSGTATVPTGRQLMVEFSTPIVSLPATTGIQFRINIGGTFDGSGAYISNSASTSIAMPVSISAHKAGTGGSMSFSVEVVKNGTGSPNIDTTLIGGGRTILKHRII